MKKTTTMMTTAKLLCCQCDNKFPLNLNVKPESITCPYCQVKMAEDMIEKVYQAALTVSDLNYHFKKYNNERNEELFQLEVIPQEIALPVDNR